MILNRAGSHVGRVIARQEMPFQKKKGSAPFLGGNRIYDQAGSRNAGAYAALSLPRTCVNLALYMLLPWCGVSDMQLGREGIGGIPSCVGHWKDLHIHACMLFGFHYISNLVTSVWIFGFFSWRSYVVETGQVPPFIPNGFVSLQYMDFMIMCLCNSLSIPILTVISCMKFLFINWFGCPNWNF